MSNGDAWREFVDWVRNGPQEELGPDVLPVPGRGYPPTWPQYAPLLVESTEASTTQFTVIPGIVGARIRLWGWHISNSGSSDRTVTLRWDVSLAQIVKSYLVFNGGQSNFYLWGKSVLGPYGEGLQATLNATGSIVFVTAFYTWEDRPEAVA